MVKLANVEIEGEAELILFTCFAVATIKDNDGTERIYDIAELKGVVRQLLKSKKPDFRKFLKSNASKHMNIDFLRDRWRYQVNRRDVMDMRAHVENHKDHYLDRAAKLLQLYQEDPRSEQIEWVL